MRTFLSTAGALLMAASAAAQGALPNFTGSWSLDAAKSDFGPMPAPTSIVMIIDHKEPTLKVAVTQNGPQGDISNESTYTTDGKSNVNKMRSPAGDQDVTSTTPGSSPPTARFSPSTASSRRRRGTSPRGRSSTSSNRQRTTGSTRCEGR